MIARKGAGQKRPGGNVSPSCSFWTNLLISLNSPTSSKLSDFVELSDFEESSVFDFASVLEAESPLEDDEAEPVEDFLA